MSKGWGRWTAYRIGSADNRRWCCEVVVAVLDADCSFGKVLFRKSEIALRRARWRCCGLKSTIVHAPPTDLFFSSPLIHGRPWCFLDTASKVESQKHSLLHQVNGLQEKLGEIQAELEKEYGTVDINIQTGEINYDVEADS